MTQRWFSLISVAIALGLTSCNPSERSSNAPAESSTSDPVLPPQSANQPPTQATKQSPTPSTNAPPSGAPTSTAASAVAPSPQAAAPQAAAPQAAAPAASREPQIDETTCGAGGQEAYFETKQQEIYICKNEAAALTYIATPKKNGNSIFLPAQKIQQGNIVGYAALDDSRTYIVTPGGFQLQENSKTLKSEKVIRRQLSGQ